MRFAHPQWTGKVLAQPDPAQHVDDDGTPLVTATQAAEAIPRLEAATVRQWASRGHIQPVRITGKGAKLYRLSDLHERIGA